MFQLSLKKSYQWVWYVLTAIPFLIYVFYISKYAVNIPQQDDYDAILSFLVDYHKATGANKIGLLFARHNEHRIFASRLVYVLYYHLTGTINFRHIIFIDAGILSATFLLLSGFIRRMLPGSWQIAVLVLSMCLFDLSNFENMIFAMAGMQNFGIVLLFVGSLWGYTTRRPVGIAVAALLQAVAVFSSGNGILASFFVVLYTFLLRHKGGAITSVLVLVVAGYLCYGNYHRIENGFFTADPQKFIPYFLLCLGAHFNKNPAMYAAVVMLVAMVVLLPVRRWFRFYTDTLPMVMILGFSVTSVGVISIFRGNLPLDTAYSSRYFIYTHIITAVLFVLYLYKYREKDLRITTSLAMVILIFFAIRNYNMGSKLLVEFSTTTVTSVFNYPNEEHARKVCNDACTINIYCIDEQRKKIK